MSSTIQFIQTTPDQLTDQINQTVENLLTEFLKVYKPVRPNEYLTRNEVKELFKVDLSTIHNWCKSGKLKPLGIGARVYFLRSDLEQSLIPLNS